MPDSLQEQTFKQNKISQKDSKKVFIKIKCYKIANFQN